MKLKVIIHTVEEGGSSNFFAAYQDSTGQTGSLLELVQNSTLVSYQPSLYIF
jgi:hypothetical protein